ncbi:guanylate kinase [Candidatus Peregrinibacteria bacterium CG_4_9_14_0_8_um_filter_44_15]|nr:MAG: hypothetical protein AUK45_05210 [Candidatus Peregrinibacteria bacterium CG2_30_44_17]PJB88709.1 MAG: guanylate kinase [Candidatus Peregrinibacteria bacterium CG_4_9_14_0_8_um_filter_44_15]
MKGKLFLILGSSGSGKGTVLAGLRDRHPEFVFPKSCTTRKPRENKTGEEVYHFVSKDEFKKMIDEGDFLEWAQVHGEHYYGTMKQPIMDALNAGHIVVREVDVQGLRSIREIIPESHIVSIFLTVGSWDELKARILNRSEMSAGELERRHQSFLTEKEWETECDHVLLTKTGECDRMIEFVESIIANEDGIE